MLVNNLHAKPTFNIHRDIGDGVAPIVAGDSAILTAIPTREALNCDGWDQIEAIVQMDGGAAPTVILQQLEVIKKEVTPGVFVDEFQSTGIFTPALLTNGMAIFQVTGGRTFLRVHAVANAPTRIRVLVSGTRRSNGL